MEANLDRERTGKRRRVAPDNNQKFVTMQDVDQVKEELQGSAGPVPAVASGSLS